MFLGDVGWVENFFDGVNRFRGLTTGFVVDDADLGSIGCWVIGVGCWLLGDRCWVLGVDAIEAVDDAFDGDGLTVNCEFVADGGFHVDDGEGREFLVDFQKSLQVVDDDSPIDDLEAV